MTSYYINGSTDYNQVIISAGSEGQVLCSHGTAEPPDFRDPPIALSTYNSVLDSGEAVSMSSGTTANITSLSLPAGTYSVSGIVVVAGSVLTLGAQTAGISTTSETMPTIGNGAVITQFPGILTNISLSIPQYLLTLESTTTVYLVASVVFTVGTITSYGRLTALKVA